VTNAESSVAGWDESDRVFKAAGGPLIEKLYGLGATAAVIGVGFALVTFVIVLSSGPARPFAITAALLIVAGWSFAATMNALMRARFMGRLVKTGVPAAAARNAWREYRAVED
jgi:hypothetical protein